MNDLEKLFLSELKDIYDAEHQLVEALSEMEQKAETAALKEAFQEHRQQTNNHKQRLELVFGELGQKPSRKTCHGIAGIINEARGLVQQVQTNQTLIISARKAEHYEISSYGSLCSWAEKLGNSTVLGLLKENLSEEKQADQKVDLLAQSIPGPNEMELRRLFVVQLREMFDGEHLLAQALAEVEFYAVSKLLKFAFRHHLKQTEKHAKRLEKVFTTIGEQIDRRPSKAVEGIIDEAQVNVLEFLGNSALDAALISAGQKAEHYEIVTYDGLCSWGTMLREHKAVDLLEANRSDEVETDKALTLLAVASRNHEASQHDSPKKTDQEAAFAKAITHGS